MKRFLFALTLGASLASASAQMGTPQTGVSAAMLKMFGDTKAFTAKADDDRRLGCAPGSQCRWQLLGVIQNNGAVELRATALTW